MTDIDRPAGPPPIEELPVLNHAVIKKSGINSVTDTLVDRPAVVLVNRKRPMGAVLWQAEYERLRSLADMAGNVYPDPLNALRKRFDERLSVLERRGAPKRIGAAFGVSTIDMARVCEPPMLAG